VTITRSKQKKAGREIEREQQQEKEFESCLRIILKNPIPQWNPLL